MVLGLKLHLRGDTFYIFEFRDILKEFSCLKPKCLTALVLGIQHYKVDRYQVWPRYIKYYYHLCHVAPSGTIVGLLCVVVA